jgi:RNA polymerase sigma-70 factor (ECF subfamily)
VATLLPFQRPSRQGEPAPASARRHIESGDDALCALARDGDHAARSEIFVRYKLPIARTIAAIIGPDAEAEDLVHETFLRAFDRLDDVESAARLGSWLRAFAVFVSREWLRKKARRRWLLFADVPESPAPSLADGMRDAVRDAFTVLDKLPVDERTAFSLRYVEGLEIEELALAMDMSVSTAKRRLRAAEERFQTLAVTRPSLREYVRSTRDAGGEP